MTSVETVVPMQSIVFCVLALVLSVGFPVALCIYSVRKGGRGTMRSVLMGAFCFIVGALVLEQIFHQLVLTVLPNLTSNVLAFSLYSMFAAGVFEETARLLGLRWLCKNAPQPITGFAYGVGHGGIEALMLGASAAFSNLYVLVTLRNSGVDAMLAAYPAEQQGLIAEQLNTLTALDPSLFMASGVERVSAICFHIAASVLIYMVVTKRIPFYGYFIAILLHAGFNGTAAAYSAGLITNVWLLEGLIFLAAVIVCAGVYAVWKKHSTAPAV